MAEPALALLADGGAMGPVLIEAVLMGVGVIAVIATIIAVAVRKSGKQTPG
jgi:hypothetical protein